MCLRCRNRRRQRARFQDVYGVPVLDRYSSQDCGVLAMDCDVHNGPHMNVVDDILEPSGGIQGEAQGILVTSLQGVPIVKIQVVQEQGHSSTIRIVRGPQYGSWDEKYIRRILGERVRGLALRLECIDKIECTALGEFPPVLSKVAAP